MAICQLLSTAKKNVSSPIPVTENVEKKIKWSICKMKETILHKDSSIYLYTKWFKTAIVYIIENVTGKWKFQFFHSIVDILLTLLDMPKVHN